MFLHSLQPYDYVINVYMANFANALSWYIGHLMLVCHQGIAASLWHYSPLIEAPWCSHSSEVNIVRMHLCLEGVCHVHLGKYFSLPAVSKYIINTGKGEVISHGVAVEHSIVIYPVQGNHQVRNSSYVFWYTECQ